jgi:hypothetical protein
MAAAAFPTECAEPPVAHVALQVDDLTPGTQFGELADGQCMHCHNRPATRVCSPCGHRVICDQCAPDLCPVCGTGVSAHVNVYEEERCVICYDARPDTIMLPCGHKCACYAHAILAWAEQRRCPICGASIVAARFQFPIFERKIEPEQSDLIPARRCSSEQAKDPEMSGGLPCEAVILQRLTRQATW